MHAWKGRDSEGKHTTILTALLFPCKVPVYRTDAQLQDNFLRFATPFTLQRAVIFSPRSNITYIHI